MTSDHDGTGEGLVEFLEFMADKGLMNKSTAGARRSAAAAILGIDDDWRLIDVRNLDMDKQVTRFKNLKKSRYSPNSLGTYESRFRSAVEEYRKFLADPTAYRPPAGAGRSSRRKPNGERRDGESPRAAVANDLPAGVGTKPPAPGPGLMQFVFPLRKDVVASFHLPADLTAIEAERMSRFLATLVIDRPDDNE